MNPKLKVVAVIPARLDSSRFPGKLLRPLGGIPVLQRTYQRVVESGLFSEVFIATDSSEIERTATTFGAKIISTGVHETGTDRIAEAAKSIEADIMINVQGDEPFIDYTSLKNLILSFENDPEEKVMVASLMHSISDREEIHNPNVVKVVTDLKNNALYFSRSPIPYPRDGESTGYPVFRHVGVYAFRRKALLAFAALPLGTLENIEKIEAIRFLENGMRMHMVETDQPGIGIDTPEDLERAEAFLKNLKPTL